MKTFIFKLEFKAAKYGKTVTNTVYRIKNNQPELVGETEYSTGSMRGHNHEAMRLIVSKGELPRTALTDSGYLNYKQADKMFKLIEL